MFISSEVIFAFIASSINWVICTIDGLSYMDSFKFGHHARTSKIYNPCNPLYWYGARIPEHCYETTTLNSYISKSRIPSKWLPTPVQHPVANIMVPQLPLPYGIPLAPTNPMIPIAGMPYPSSQRQYGMVPGLPGLVSPDGGINVLPFSDVYADVLENHKQKEIRRRLQKVLDKYESFPRRRSYKQKRYRY